MSGESKPLTVGFVGAGQMATALAKGFVEHCPLHRSSPVTSSPPQANVSSKSLGDEWLLPIVMSPRNQP